MPQLVVLLICLPTFKRISLSTLAILTYHQNCDGTKQSDCHCHRPHVNCSCFLLKLTLIASLFDLVFSLMQIHVGLTWLIEAFIKTQTIFRWFCCLKPYHFIFYVKNAIVVFKEIEPKCDERLISFICHDFHCARARLITDVRSWRYTVL